MSGVFGILRLDGAPVDPRDLETMSGLLARRGPTVRTWTGGPVALGHRSLPTTPEAVVEVQPLVHAASGCVIVADVRLDNREELLRLLGLDGRGTGDAAIVLEAYLRFGPACPARLLGDFAFAIWDPRSRELVCARDQIGLRQLVHHHGPGRLLAFATDTRAVLGLEDVPYRINEARIADHLVEGLEGVDTTSTFFEGVHRLPAAHTLAVRQDGRVILRRYWSLEPGTPLPDDPRAVAEGLLDVLTTAVDARLRTVGPPASMLSGGMDSGSAVAIARTLLAARGEGPLLTFSGVSTLGRAEPETRAILDAVEMTGIDATLVDHDAWAGALAAVQRRMAAADEPWDATMAMAAVLYDRAQARGARAMLDGVAGDIVLAEGRYLARLLRRGRLVTAGREAVLQDRFWKGGYPPRTELAAALRTAFLPRHLGRFRAHRARERARACIAASAVHPDLVRRVAVEERLLALERHGPGWRLGEPGAERARGIDHPYLVVARERYDRVAATAGVEPRDPFCDRRVVGFSTTIPDGHLLVGGWPKTTLRHAVAGLLPDPVRWRTGKENPGWRFTQSLMSDPDGPWQEIADDLTSAAPYVAGSELEAVRRFRDGLRGDTVTENAYTVLQLGAWLRHHARRPSIEPPIIERGTAS